MRGTDRIWSEPKTTTIVRSSAYSLRVLPCVVELYCILSGRMFLIQRLCRSNICGQGAEYMCCGKFFVPICIYTVNQLLIVASSHTDVLTHDNTSGWPIIQISNTLLRAYTTGIIYSYPCDMNHSIDRFVMGVIWCLVLNYSHSRNPPCAPARTHGRTQAPREPPN
jgi:hypothetical protein